MYRGEEEDTLGEASAREAFNQLLRTIEGRVDAELDHDGVRLVLYVDEAHTLVEAMLDEDGGKTLYDAFCSSLNAFVGCPIFTIFFSTISHLGWFAPPGPLARYSGIP